MKTSQANPHKSLIPTRADTLLPCLPEQLFEGRPCAVLS